MHQAVKTFVSVSPGTVHKRNPSVVLGSSRALYLMIIGAAIFVSGCGVDTETIWSVEAKSPNGKWMASGRADRHTGPGNAAIETGVYLQPTNKSVRAQPVLMFLNNLPPDRGGIGFEIDWLAPSHLQVTFIRQPDISFLVTKYAGVEISVRELSSVTSIN
jgi:hypothetical protein